MAGARGCRKSRGDRGWPRAAPSGSASSPRRSSARCATVVQDETPEHWVAHFAGFGVVLHYLELTDRPCWGAGISWQRRFAAAYDWLRAMALGGGPFDVVHTSEWRGGLVHALAAKRLGLAFEETLFLVKTSSPHIWNRHYQMQPIDQPDLLVAAYAEQKCVELADMVIGGCATIPRQLSLILIMGESVTSALLRGDTIALRLQYC